MTIAKKTDIFCISNEPIKGMLKPSLDLNSDLPKLKIPVNFKKSTLLLPEREYGPKLRKFVEPYAQDAEKKGFSLSIFTALYEAILNAHQHANQLSEDKKIIVGNLCSKKSLEYIICDEGEKLPEHFTSFILNLRYRNIAEQGPIDWYDYSGNKRPQINNGTGSSFMHTYMDNIKYFISEDTGGLAVYMRKDKK